MSYANLCKLLKAITRLEGKWIRPERSRICVTVLVCAKYSRSVALGYIVIFGWGIILYVLLIETVCCVWLFREAQ
jgi:hypothetical protein